MMQCLYSVCAVAHCELLQQQEVATHCNLPHVYLPGEEVRDHSFPHFREHPTQLKQVDPIEKKVDPIENGSTRIKLYTEYLEKRDFLSTSRRESLTEELNCTSGCKEKAKAGNRFTKLTNLPRELGLHIYCHMYVHVHAVLS